MKLGCRYTTQQSTYMKEYILDVILGTYVTQRNLRELSTSPSVKTNIIVIKFSSFFMVVFSVISMLSHVINLLQEN